MKMFVTGATGSVGGRAIRYRASRGLRTFRDRAEENKEDFAF